jgi:quinoprotein glucose dehydrogenase
MNTGDHVWQIPLGDGIRQRLIDSGIPDPGPLGGGGSTGPLLTKTLLFIGHNGARDGTSGGPALLALDKDTGRTIHVIELPSSATGTPMTYMANGRQHIVVAFGRGGEAGLIALALR